jgi:hypothetical protein
MHQSAREGKEAIGIVTLVKQGFAGVGSKKN